MIHQIFFSFRETIILGWAFIGLLTLNDTLAPLHTGYSRFVLTWRKLSPVGILVNDHSYGLLNNFPQLFSSLDKIRKSVRPYRLEETYRHNSPEAKPLY